jgi:predicted DNA-binding antitoxin AbrB/MazE fold protein
MTTIIEAIFNGQVFEPTELVKLKPNTKVKLTIEPEINEEVNQDYSFLKTARSLKIDAPADFSANIDEYLYCFLET